MAAVIRDEQVIDVLLPGNRFAARGMRGLRTGLARQHEGADWASAMIVLRTLVALVPMVGIACNWILLLRNVGFAHYSAMVCAIELLFGLRDVVAVIVPHIVRPIIAVIQ